MVRLVLILTLLALLVGTAGADYLFNWSALPTVSDPDNTHPTDGSMDILPGIWYGADGAVRYFRMDLEDPPYSPDVLYVFAVNVLPDPPGTVVPPNDFPYGVDYGVYAQTNGVLTQWGVYLGSTFINEGVTGQITENGGRSVEFAVDTTRWPDLAGEMRFWGATYYQPIASVLDITASYLTPEPGPVALLLSGLGLLAWWRRSRQRA